MFFLIKNLNCLCTLSDILYTVMKKCAEFMQNQKISMDVLQAVAEDSIFENRLLWTFRAARTRAELLHRKGICDLVAIVDIAQAIMAPQTMLDFFPKLVIIKHRLVHCEEYQASNVFDRASFIIKFNLCEDLRVPEREVFIDVFNAATVQKASIQRNKAGTRMPEVSWRLAVGC